MAFCVLVFLVCVGLTACEQEESFERIVSEKLIAQIDFSSWDPDTFKISADCRRVAYVAETGDKQVVVVNGESGKEYDAVGNPIFSPDCKHLAYTARTGDRRVVVVDGKEGKKYDAVDSPVFSPDGKRVAYAIKTENEWCVVIDGKMGEKYSNLVAPAGSKIMFDSVDSFHYLVQNGSSIYLVEERIE